MSERPSNLALFPAISLASALFVLFAPGACTPTESGGAPGGPAPAADAQDDTESDAQALDPNWPEQTETYHLEGRVVRPSGLEGQIHLLFYESTSQRCTDDPAIFQSLTPGDFVGEAVIATGESFSVDVDVDYIGQRPSLEVIAYLDVAGDGRCDPDGDSGAGLTLEPGDQSGLEIVLERGRCLGLALLWLPGSARAS